MKKKNGFIISIDSPCSENWDNMSNTGADKKARHCASCNKSVIDFSNYTDKELLDFISKSKGNICGRLSPYQVNRPIISYEPNNNSLLQKFMLGTALATSLAACNESTTNTQTKEQQHLVVGGIQRNPTTDNTLNNYISGTVKDDKDNVPVAEMMVSIAGTNYYSITDIDGNFKIDFPDSIKSKKMTLVFNDMNKVSLYNISKMEYDIDEFPFTVNVKLHATLLARGVVQTETLTCVHTTGIIAVAPIPSFPPPGNDNDSVHTIVTNMPKYNKNINDYITEHIVYPKEMHDEGVEGTVFVSFIIETSGEVSHVKVLKGVRAPLDSAAIKVIANMPKWTPGSQNGHNVRVQFTIPIRFELGNSAKSK